MKPGRDHIGISIVYFCHDGQGNFVMAKRSQNARDEKGKWDTGGGAMEFGHTVEETLKKEIKEEYSTDVLAFDFLGYRDVHRAHEGERTHWVALDFKVLVDKKKVKIGEPHKFDDLQWFRLGNIPENLYSQLRKFFEKYKKQLF